MEELFNLDTSLSEDDIIETIREIVLNIDPEYLQPINLQINPEKSNKGLSVKIILSAYTDNDFLLKTNDNGNHVTINKHDNFYYLIEKVENHPVVIYEKDSIEHADRNMVSAVIHYLPDDKSAIELYKKLSSKLSAEILSSSFATIIELTKQMADNLTLEDHHELLKTHFNNDVYKHLFAKLENDKLTQFINSKEETSTMAF